MKVMGFTVLALVATLLAPSYSAPSPTFDPITAASFTAAGGLVRILDIFCVCRTQSGFSGPDCLFRRDPDRADGGDLGWEGGGHQGTPAQDPRQLSGRVEKGDWICVQ